MIHYGFAKFTELALMRRQTRRDAAAIAAGIALLVAAMPIAASGRAARSDMDKDIERIVARNVAAMVPANGAGGVAVAVRVDGRTLFFNYGLADRSEKRPITSESLFNIGSVRKVFEAALVAQAVLRSELKLDDPVNKYVGELQGDYIRHVTIGQLVTHTSGLLLPTDHPPWPRQHYSLAGFLDALNTWTPQNGEQPGKQRVYTHAGYVLLQLVLERRYGLPIGKLIDAGVIRPLGLSSTFVPERGPDDRAILAPQLLRRAVQGYANDGESIGLPGNQQGYFDFPGTGQMFSSARDLAVLLAACLDDGTIDPQLHQALRLTQNEAFRVSPQYGQAMAWEVNSLGGPTIIDKPGGLNNASAYIGLIPERRLGIVILSNRGDVHPYDAARDVILPELARLVRPGSNPAGSTARQ
jgi:beta-lactamase class C